MKIFSVVFSFALTGSLFSQITLSGSDFAGANDTVRISQTMDPVIDYTLTGPNFSWDFSGLTAASQYLKYFQPVSNSTILVEAEYGFTAPTQYKASYFLESRDIPIDQLNQFLPAELSDLNQFSRKTADSITALGYSLSVNGQALPFKSDTIETVYKFPTNYEDTFSTRGYTYIDLNPVTDFKLKQYRQRTSVVDGFGTLITPFGTFEVLRIKSVINELDSVYQTFFGGGSWNVLPQTVITEYEWWAQGKDEAMLKVVAVENNGTSQIRSIEYQDIYLGLDASIKENSFEFNLVPNPANNLISIESDLAIEQIKVIGLDGSVVLKQNTNNVSKATIEISMLQAGVYFVEVSSGKFTATQKLIKL
jgi:hypothetical protein